MGRSALCETHKGIREIKVRYLKCHYFGLIFVKNILRNIFQSHILWSQAYGWIGIRKIWVFSKQSSYVDERVKVRIFTEREKNKELTIPRVLLWLTFCILTEMLPVERVVAN